MQRTSISTAALAFLFSGLLFPVLVADAAIGFTCNNSTGTTGTCQASCGAATVAITDVSGVCSPTESCCAPAAATTTTATTVTIDNPLGYNTVQAMAGAILSALQGIIVTLSLVFIVIGAVLYIVSAGDEGRIKTAKAAITAAMIGLAIGIAAPSFIKEIYGILGEPAPAIGGKTLLEIAQNVLNFLLSLVGVLAIIMLVWGGIMYLTSAGDEKRADTAKAIVKWAIIGISVALASLVLVTQVANFF